MILLLAFYVVTAILLLCLAWPVVADDVPRSRAWTIGIALLWPAFLFLAACFALVDLFSWIARSIARVVG